MHGLTQGVKELALLWLWCRVAAAAPNQPLPWELSYTVGAALKRQKKKRRRRQKTALWEFYTMTQVLLLSWIPEPWPRSPGKILLFPMGLVFRISMNTDQQLLTDPSLSSYSQSKRWIPVFSDRRSILTARHMVQKKVIFPLVLTCQVTRTH